jgi:hypothetical protein
MRHTAVVRIAIVVLLVVGMLVTAPGLALARGGGHGGGMSGGGMHSGGGGHHGGHSHGHRSIVVFGGGFGWGGAWGPWWGGAWGPWWGGAWGPWWGPWGPTASFPSSGFVSEAAVWVQGPSVQSPPVDRPGSGYWHYCLSARGYYPDVPSCPEPWILVAPRSLPNGN